MSRNAATIIVGAQWGDEGKGKVVDRFSADSALVVRCAGGNNAGHTIVVDGERFALHHVPSGILHAGVQCALGAGMVIDTGVLANELEQLEARDIDVSRLVASPQAHIILPHHKALDAAHDGRAGVGTTGRGIGPSYADKATRIGVRVGDLHDQAIVRERVEIGVRRANALLREVYDAPTVAIDDVLEAAAHAARVMKGRITDVGALAARTLDAGDAVLLEGAQGVLLDIDHGTWPYVTSSQPTAAGALAGAGLGPNRAGRVVGVAKAYLTRVGAGAFPTELHDDVAAFLVERGHERGTTTGRTRRVGWLDVELLRRAIRIGGITELALTKLDVLGDLDEVRLCTGWSGGDAVHTLAANTLAQVEPVWESLPGWSCEEITRAATREDLPNTAKAYVSRIEELAGIPISWIGTGADRSALLAG